MLQPPPIVLSFAANDPSGGAGIQADSLTIASLGCHPLPIITAATVQDTAGVEDIFPLDSECVADQARAVLEDMPVHVFKIGLLGSVEIIAAIAEVISDYPSIPLVLDPILISGRGDELVDEEMMDAMRELLLPQATVLTPNSLEARQLSQDEDEDEDPQKLDLILCAHNLLDMGCEHVLITGTHENTVQVTNTLFDENGIVRSDSWQRLAHSYHGSGCTLSSAIASLMAKGLSIEQSVFAAQDYTWQTLNTGFRPGMGQYIPNRLFGLENNKIVDKS